MSANDLRPQVSETWIRALSPRDPSRPAPRVTGRHRPSRPSLGTVEEARRRAEDPGPAPGRASRGWSERPSAGRARAAAAPALALVLWAISLAGVDLAGLDDTGLASVLPVTFFAALGVLIVGFVLEVGRPEPRGWVIAVHVATLVLVLHGTVPLLYDTPRYTYAYKHIAVSRYVMAHGSVDREIEIYQNWAGFPSLVAHVSWVTGMDPMVFANAAQLCFAAANVLAVRFALRGLTLDDRLVAVAVWAFVLADWVGQNYFAPQALAFLLSIVAVGLVLRGAPTRRRLALAADEPLRPFAMSAPASCALATALIACVTLVHPLSPFLLISWIGVLVVFGRWRLWWMLVVAGVMAAVWTGAASAWLGAHVDLFGDVGSAASNAKGTGGPSPGSAGHQLVVRCARVLSLGVWALAGIGTVVRWRQGRRDPTVVALAVAPFSLLVGQSYGGEAIYRIYLFSLPWCCFLVATAILGRPHTAPGRARQVLVATTSAVMAVLFVFAHYGLERINHVTPDEVAASTWFEEHAPPGSVLGLVVGNFPVEVTADYDKFRSPWGTWGAAMLTEGSPLVGRDLTADDLPEAFAILRSYGAPHIYLVLSPGQAAYAEAFGLAPVGAVERFGDLLEAAPETTVVHREGDVTILEVR